ncbi:MAG: hypothetical protein ACKVZ6_12940 [Kineosporiaceae bacterium]
MRLIVPGPAGARQAGVHHDRGGLSDADGIAAQSPPAEDGERQDGCPATATSKPWKPTTAAATRRGVAGRRLVRGDGGDGCAEKEKGVGGAVTGGDDQADATDDMQAAPPDRGSDGEVGNHRGLPAGASWPGRPARLPGGFAAGRRSRLHILSGDGTQVWPAS